jgi:hypothetical protein
VKARKVMCVECGKRESTGIMILMCDPCFDAFEKRVESGEQSELGKHAIAPEFRAPEAKA